MLGQENYDRHLCEIVALLHVQMSAICCSTVLYLLPFYPQWQLLKHQQDLWGRVLIETNQLSCCSRLLPAQVVSDLPGLPVNQTATTPTSTPAASQKKGSPGQPHLTLNREEIQVGTELKTHNGLSVQSTE